MMGSVCFTTGSACFITGSILVECDMDEINKV